MLEQVSVLHVHVGELVSVSFEIAAENGVAVADAGQFPVIQVKVRGQADIEMASVIGIEEIDGARYVILPDMCDLC